VQAELGYISRAEMMAKNILPKELSKAIANALKTAKCTMVGHQKMGPS
jgi:hypothetical protein